MERILRQKHIDWLVHFTQAENLISILEYGLLPRDILEKNEIQSVFNDDYRYDECKDALCTSVEFPNYKMFYTLRQDDPDVDWVVLLLDARILCDFECAYCHANAGSAEMYNTPIEDRKGKEAFLSLFKDYPGYPSREELGINDWLPTNPQAEVLIFHTIPINYINKICFNRLETKNKFENIVPKSIITEVNTKYFFGREDWRFW